MDNLTILFGIISRALQEKVHKSLKIFQWIILDKRADQFF